MKASRIVVLFSSAILCLSLFAPSLRAADNMDGLMMQNGKMMMMKDGKATGPMVGDMTMPNGIKVMTDGAVMMKDGTKTQMKEGQMMMMDGHMMEGGKRGMMGGDSTGGMNH